MDLTGIVSDTTGIVPDTTGIVSDTTGIVLDTAGIVLDTTGIVYDLTGIVPDMCRTVECRSRRMYVGRLSEEYWSCQRVFDSEALELQNLAHQVQSICSRSIFG